MIVRSEVCEATGKLADAAGNWRRAYDRWRRARDERDRVAEQTARQVTKATGGVGVARWEQLCRRRSVHDVAAATAKARAIRARPAVEAALVARAGALAVRDAELLAARVALAEASKAVAALGTAGPALVGQSAAELRRLARRPAHT